MKIVYMGTPDFSVRVLEKIVESGIDIPLVVTQPDKSVGRGKKVVYTKVKEYALLKGLNVIQPEDVNQIVNEIKNVEPDFIVTCAYGQFLSEQILSLAKINSVNVHASLLPRHRGGAPIHRAILEGDTQTGISIIEMVKKMDAGDIFAIDSIKIETVDTLETIHDKLAIMGGELIVKTLHELYEGRVNRVRQDENLVTYSPNISKEERIINFNDNSQSIFNKVRAFNPFPMSYAIYNDKMIKIHCVSILTSKSNFEPGTIVDITIDGIKVATKDNDILITKLQAPGKRAVTAQEFYHGNSILEVNGRFK